MGLSEAVLNFLVAWRQRGRSLATVRSYGWQLAQLVSWLGDRGVDRIGDVSADLLRSWGASLWDAGWSASSVKVAVSACRAWAGWCAEQGLMDCNLSSTLVVPRVPQRAQRTVSIGEVRLMLAACGGGVKGCRDRALVMLLVDTGLRSAEVCRVEVAMVDVAARRLRVLVKRGSVVDVWYGSACAQALAAWLEVRGAVAAPGVAEVFVSIGGRTRGRPLTVSGLRCVLRKLGQLAGVAGVSTHAFRRSFAVIALEAGASVRVVQDAGRWSDIRQVERYSLAMRRGLLYESGASPGDLVDGGGG